MRDTTVENVLGSHPSVREAAALRDGNGDMVAFVVPDESYLSRELDGAAAENSTLNKWQKTYDLSQLTKEAATAEVGFNIAGWNSSYTRQPIPAAEIREWVECSVASILALRPSRVYEIGCGPGLLATRIAPVCERYLAADFSSIVLARLRGQLEALPALADRIELSHRLAHDFTGLDADAFDTVVLNSVAQYFPSLAYLTTVLEQAVRAVKPGGHIYVGDVRSLPLLPMFATSIELFRAQDEMTAAALKARIANSMERERELVLSPAYFLRMQRQLARIARVEIRPERGRSGNEMIRYRFNTVLHVGHGREAGPAIEFEDWHPRRWSLGNIRAAIEKGLEQPIALKAIRNARLAQDLEAMEMLGDVSSARTAGEIRREAANRSPEGILPEDLFDLQAAHPDVAVDLSWAAARSDGSYDAILIPRRLQDAGDLIWPQPETRNFMRLSNMSFPEKTRRTLIQQIGAYASERLPLEQRPVRIELVDGLVKDGSGGLDDAAMLALNSAAWRTG